MKHPPSEPITQHGTGSIYHEVPVNKQPCTISQQTLTNENSVPEYSQL